MLYYNVLHYTKLKNPNTSTDQRDSDAKSFLRVIILKLDMLSPNLIVEESLSY